MTFKEIQTALAEAGKPLAEAQVYRYIRKCEIRLAGASQRPQRYADDSAVKILAHLGLVADAPPLAPGSSVGLVKLPALKRARALAKKGAAK